MISNRRVTILCRVFLSLDMVSEIFHHHRDSIIFSTSRHHIPEMIKMEIEMTAFVMEFQYRAIKSASFPSTPFFHHADVYS